MIGCCCEYLTDLQTLRIRTPMGLSHPPWLPCTRRSKQRQRPAHRLVRFPQIARCHVCRIIGRPSGGRCKVPQSSRACVWVNFRSDPAGRPESAGVRQPLGTTAMCADVIVSPTPRPGLSCPVVARPRPPAARLGDMAACHEPAPCPCRGQRHRSALGGALGGGAAPRGG